MKFLSTRRRHPLAGVVVLLMGLLVMGGLYATLNPASADNAGKQDKQLIEQGRHLYVVSCSSCHGMNGAGVVTKDGNNFGPPLIGVGAAAVDFQVGTGRMPMARPGTQAAQREPIFNDQETRALAAYVASLGPGPAIPPKEKYSPKGLSEEEIAQGGQFFRTNCTACHNYAGSGGALPHGRHAPNLRSTSAKHIYEAMITGPQEMPVFSDDVLKPDEKRKVIGYIKSVDNEASRGGANLGLLGPVTEGMFAWVAGIGGLVLVAAWIAHHGVRTRKKR